MELEFNGTSTTLKSFASTQYGFSIINDGKSGIDQSLTFTINSLSITVKAGEVYYGAFNAFTQVYIVTTVPYRARALSYLDMTRGDNSSTNFNTSILIVDDGVAPEVTVSPVSGVYTNAQKIRLSTNKTVDTTIFYTKDGTTPTEESLIYSNPIIINSNTTLKYFAKDRFGNTSTLQQTNYTINIQGITPSVTSGLVSVYNIAAHRSGRVIVDSISGNNLLMGLFAMGDGAISDGGIRGDGRTTIVSPSLGSSGSFTVFTTYKWRRKAYSEQFQNHNVFSILPDLSLNTNSSGTYVLRANTVSYTYSQSTVTPPTAFAKHGKHDTVCLRYDSVAGTVKFYLNGKEVAQHPYNIGANTPKLTLFGGVNLLGTVNGYGVHTFKNALFYNRALSSLEVLSVTNEISASKDIYDTFDTTNYLTTVDQGLIEAYDLTKINTPYHNSLVGYGRLYNLTPPTVAKDGGMLGGQLTSDWDYHKGLSGTYVLRAALLSKSSQTIVYTAYGFSLRIELASGGRFAILMSGSSYGIILLPSVGTDIHTYAFTIEEIGTNCIVKSYKDGVFVSTNTVASSTLIDMPNKRMTDINNNGNARKYAILNYDRALTAAEVAQVHADLSK